MPLVRFELKNEYGLGDSRLYQGARKKEEDPRNIFSGFTVSGLVGILRQLGDLAEFASIVFNDVHQQVIATTARGHKVMNRIRKIEAALPQFEKAVQKQKSHIHFAYIAGCEWHANIQTGKSELYGSDLPEYMMDSYEECHDPPHLHLLDKFDSAGAGACLKRYSDPSYLRKVVASSESMMVGKSHNGSKAHRKKKQRSRGSNGLACHSVHMTLHGRSSNSSAQYPPVVTDELRFSVDDASISDTFSTSNFTNELMYFSSDKRSGCLEVQNTSLSTSMELYDDDLSAIEAETKQNVDCISKNHIKDGASDNVIQDLMPLQNSVFSTSICSDEKIEMTKSVSQMLSHVIPEDALNSPKTVELSSVSSNSCYGTNGPEMQMKLVSRSLNCDETATVACGKSIFSTYSATCDVKNETMEPKNSRFPDGISPPRPPDLDSGQINELTSQMDKDMDETNALDSKVQTTFEDETRQEALLLPHPNYDAMKCEVNMTLDGVEGDISPYRIQDSNILLLTLETANQQCEMSGTEMLNQGNVLSNTILGINELKTQLDKHIDATSGLNFKVKMNFDNQLGQGAILLPHLNYYGIDCGVDKIVGVDSRNIDVGCDIIPFRPQDSEYFLNLEMPNQHCEMTGTEMSNKENFLLNSMKMVVPSLDGGQIREEITSQIDNHVDATNALDFKVQENFEYQTGGVIMLSNQNYDGMECELNKIPGVSTTSIYDTDGGIVYESCTSLIKKTYPQVFDHLKPAGSAEFPHKQHYAFENSVCKSLSSASSTENDSEAINSNISSSQTVVIDRNLTEQSSSQDSFGDTNKTTSQKEVLCELQIKMEVESETDSNFKLTEYQNSLEKVITSSKLIGPTIETPVASCSSSNDSTSPILSDTISFDTVDNISSTLSSDVNLSGHLNHVLSCSASSTENDSEAINSNISSSQTVVIDRNLTEHSSPQDSFGDTAKTTRQKEVLCECQTKWEVESETDSNFRLTEYQNSLETVIASSKLIGPTIETLVAFCSSSNDSTSPILSDTISFNTVDNVTSTFSSDVNLSGHLNHVLSPRNVSKDPAGNMSSQLTKKSVILPSNVTATKAVESQGLSVDSHRMPLINIWTNGGLLGLEPSKPPDISVPNVYCSDRINDDRSFADSQSCMLGNKSESKNLFFEQDKSNHVASFPEKDNFTDLDINGAKGRDGINFSEADVRSKNESESHLSKKNNIGISVGFSSLAHRLPVNSLQRNSSNTSTSPFCELINKDVHKLDGSIFTNHKEIPKLAKSSTPLHKLENKDAAHGFSDKSVSSSLDPSGYQSPPLEHMKVSFQPMNSSDSSKLRLEFRNVHLPGNTGDLMFPSFQLLSESFHPRMDDASESDDDTFCRSCSYSSDDLLTLYSDSDAETWGEDGLDVSNRIEATCSISSFIDDESNTSRVSQVNHAANSKHGSNAFSSQRLSNTCNSSVEPSGILQLPPNELQPTQLRALKPSSANVTESFSSHHL